MKYPFSVLPRRRATRIGALVVIVALPVFLATRPVTTKQGVNYEVSTHRIPLYLKAFQFVDRSAQYEQIAGEVVRGATSDAERALEAFEWTRRHIRPTPDGWPVVDDHILNIITRGHGMPDQQADVFATIATYAGVPAFWQTLRLPVTRTGLVLSFARVDHRWVVFDVARGIVFRDAQGRHASLDALKGHPELVPASVRLLQVNGVPYADLVTKLEMPEIPDPFRAELQMPSVRLWHEVKAALRLEHHNEPE